MKVVILIASAFLAACSTVPYSPPIRDAQSAMWHGRIPPIYAPGVGALSGDEIRLLDSRVIRAMRSAELEAMTRGLTREQKLAIYLGVSIVAAYLISEWIEDNVVLLPPG